MVATAYFSDSDFQESNAFALWCSHDEPVDLVEPDEYLYEQATWAAEEFEEF